MVNPPSGAPGAPDSSSSFSDVQPCEPPRDALGAQPPAAAGTRPATASPGKDHSPHPSPVAWFIPASDQGATTSTSGVSQPRPAATSSSHTGQNQQRAAVFSAFQRQAAAFTATPSTPPGALHLASRGSWNSRTKPPAAPSTSAHASSAPAAIAQCSGDCSVTATTAEGTQQQYTGAAAPTGDPTSCSFPAAPPTASGPTQMADNSSVLEMSSVAQALEDIAQQLRMMARRPAAPCASPSPCPGPGSPARFAGAFASGGGGGRHAGGAGASPFPAASMPAASMPSAGAPIGGDAGAAGSKPGAAGAPYGACASLQHHGPPVSKLAGDTGATPSPPLFVFGAGGAANIGNGGSSGAVPPGFTPAAWPGAGTTAGSSSTAPVVVFQGRSPAGATAEACTSVVVNQVACTSVVVSSDPGYIPVPRGGPRKMQRPEGSSFQEETASGTQHSTVAVAASKGGSLTAGDGAGDEDSKGEEEEEEDEEGCWEPEGKKVKGAIRECESDEGEADKGEGQEQEKQKEQKEEAGCTAVALVAAGPEAAEPNDTAGDDDPRLSPPKRVSGAGTDPQDAYSFALGSLPDAVLCHVFDKLPPNETPVCRLACKGVAACLTQKRYRTLHLREPLPGYAQEIADCLLVLADPELEGLSYVKQVQLLYTAAASGSVLNMAAADALMDRIMPPDMRASGDWRDELHRGELDPATSAAKAGHLNCVMWCIRNKGLVWSTDELMLAVAQHCKLEDWGQLGEVLVRDRFGRMEYYRGSLPLELKHHGAALDSPWGDARGKVQRLVEHGWVEGSGMGSGSSAWRVIEMVQAGEPMAEVRKAFLEVVGGDLDAEKLVYLVARTLQSGRLDVAEWLWTKLHVRLHPGMAGGAKDSAYNVVLDRLARAGAVVGLRWLRGRGLELEGPGLPRPLLAAAEAGQLAAVRFFVEECGHRADEAVFASAAGSGSLSTAAWLLSHRCPTSPAAYYPAAKAGDLPMLHFLLHTASCPWDRTTLATLIRVWPRRTHGDARGLLAAVKQLVGAGCALPRCRVHSDLVDFAVQRGELELVQYLAKELGLGLGCRALRKAVASGSLGLVRWIIAEKKGCGETGKQEEKGAGEQGEQQQGEGERKGSGEAGEHEQKQGAEAGARVGTGMGVGAGAGTGAGAEAAAGAGAGAGATAGAGAGAGAEVWYEGVYEEAGSRGYVCWMAALHRWGVPFERTVLAEAVKRFCPLKVLQWLVEHGAPAGRDEVTAALWATRSCWAPAKVTEWLKGLLEGLPAVPPRAKGVVYPPVGEAADW